MRSQWSTTFNRICSQTWKSLSNITSGGTKIWKLLRARQSSICKNSNHAFRNKTPVLEESDSKSFSDILELSVSSSDVDAKPKHVIFNQKRTNSEFWTPVADYEERKKLFRWASQHFFLNVNEKTTQEEKYLWNQNLKTQNEQLNHQLKKYKNYLDSKFECQKPIKNKSIIAEEADENKSSSCAVSFPTKIHEFDNKLEGRMKNLAENSPKWKLNIEISNNPGCKSALDIFRARYSNLLQ